jgi:pSer/pThr/pTyr-binding forkhead associated (FHA) protein
VATGDTQSVPHVADEVTPLGTPAVVAEGARDVLVVNSGPSLGARFEVGDDDVSVGRSVTSDIFLDDVTVSRSHARFVRTDSGRLAVQDAGSLNGTYVNHVRVEEKILDSGDEIQIGKFKLMFLAARNP